MQIKRARLESRTDGTTSAASESVAVQPGSPPCDGHTHGAGRPQHAVESTPQAAVRPAFDDGLAQTLLQATPVPLMALDMAGKIMLWNRAASHCVGWTEADVLGQPPPMLPAAHAEVVQTLFRDLLRGTSTTTLETTLHTTHGRHLEVLLTAAPLRDQQQTWCGIIVTTTDLTRRNTLARRSATERAVTRLLTEDHPLARTMPLLLQIIGDGLAWDIGFFWQVDPAANLLCCRASWHAPDVAARPLIEFSRRQSVPAGSGLPGRVWLSGKPAWIGGVVTDMRSPRMQLMTRAGFRGAYVFPAGYQGTVLGVLEFVSRKSRQPSDDLLQLFDLMGRQLGQWMTSQQARQAHAP